MENFNTIKLEKNTTYTLLALNRGKSNPINMEMLNELHTCFNQLKKDESVLGVILTGQEHFFSVGVDVVEVFNYDREQSKEYWSLLFSLMVKMAKFQKPLIVTVSGHSPAGGCVLAIPADWRIMVDGSYTIGLNEVPLGIIVPENFFHIYSFWLGRGKAYQYLLEGKLLSVDQALEHGLIDEKCSGETLLKKAEEKMNQYLRIIPNVFQTSKMNFRRELFVQLDIDFEDSVETFLDQWWSKETRATIKGLIERLKK
ncbi:MAG: enoyl-CoA hydratase/isomerase family protein [Calditrichaeota bacterium]|nr:MAG: enoyl-CoA hydratase/isomerase family protein [Calditrichota bacterium]MBL1203818.1 enoyl-CoA hydratase/isomerase family protein [Calditrichota bacterium]NOG43648.1 enoyl-CoA hydratase/isomerase family protein [Calditrichota bacterium]